MSNTKVRGIVPGGQSCAGAAAPGPLLELAEVQAALRGDDELAIQDQQHAQGPAGSGDLRERGAEAAAVAGLEVRMAAGSGEEERAVAVRFLLNRC